MKTFALLLLLLVASVALAGDIVLKNAGTAKGSVISLNCLADGGLSCTRDAGAAGTLQCNGASSTEPGCMLPNAAQALSGQKSFLNGEQVACVAHASLTACSSPNAGLHQCCSTHGNALVHCNGTTNIELSGSAQAVTIATLYSAGLFSSGTGANIAGLTLPYAYTVTGISSYVQQGTGVGQFVNMRFTDGTNVCDCPIPCDADSTSAVCSGNCSFVASTQVAARPGTDGCTTPVTIRSPVVVGGYLQ